MDKVQEENDIEFSEKAFDQVLFEIFKLLTDVVVIYPTPSRISIQKTLHLVEAFISEPSGGDRLEAVTTSLFRVISEKFGLFDEIKREKVNTSDVISGMGADIECRLKGVIVLLVEVKDRRLNLTQLDAKIDVARARQIREILFVAQQGIESSNEDGINEKITQEYTSGQNIYVVNFAEFARGILILLGEQGRVSFISKIGPELDASKSSIKHRKTWAALLKQV